MAITAHPFFDPEGSTRRVAEDMGQDWVRDSIHRADVLDQLKREPDVLVKYFDFGQNPRRGLPVPVPKTSLTVRPAVSLRPVDRIAYQGLVDLFCVDEMADLPDFVCGWCYKRNPNSPDDLVGNSTEWHRYESLLEKEWNDGSRFVLATDIAGFFQSIPHSLLRERLSGIQSELRTTLLRFLQIWNPTGIGLPQRVLASSLLANLYLEPLDEVLSGYRAIRWMDDIVIFCDSRREAVRAMLRIQEALGQTSLLLNGQKTFLVPFDEADFLLRLIRNRQIEYRLEVDPDEGQVALGEAWETLVEELESADRTQFSFCVTRFAEHEITDPAEVILDNLGRIPHVSDHVSRYLRSQLDDPDVLERVTRFLRGYNNQFVWQEYRLATLFWHADSLSEEQLSFVRNRAGNSSTYWASRAIYFRALAKHGDKSDARQMRDLSESERNPELARGLILAVAESGQLARSVIKKMGRDDPELETTVKFLLARDLKVPPMSY